MGTAILQYWPIILKIFIMPVHPICLKKFIILKASYLIMTFRGKLTPTENELWENITRSKCATESEFLKLGKSWPHGLPASSQVSGLTLQ